MHLRLKSADTAVNRVKYRGKILLADEGAPLYKHLLGVHFIVKPERAQHISVNIKIVRNAVSCPHCIKSDKNSIIIRRKLHFLSLPTPEIFKIIHF